MVELHHGIDWSLEQNLVKRHNLAPVSLFEARRFVVESGNGGLQLVRPGPIDRQTAAHQLLSLRDESAIPNATVLVGEQHEVTVGADARLPGARDYSRTWGLNARTLEMLPRDALVLHPGPVNRGVEIASDVLDSPRSLVMDQVDSGVAVRMAVLALCLRAEVPA